MKRLLEIAECDCEECQRSNVKNIYRRRRMSRVRIGSAGWRDV